MMRYVMAGLFLAGLALAAGDCPAQEGASERATATVEGKVLKVDARGGSLTIQSVNELTFSVPSAAPVTADDTTTDRTDMTLADINQGDYVRVAYYEGPSGDLVATAVVLEYTAAELVSPPL